MARPKNKKHVCCQHEGTSFGLRNTEYNEVLPLPVDAYETIRLIDYQGLTQQEAADEMKVARTTVQSLYQNARKILAKSLFEGALVTVENVEHVVVGDNQCCQKNPYIERIAITTDFSGMVTSYDEAEVLIIYSSKEEDSIRKDKLIAIEESELNCRKFLISLGVTKVITASMTKKSYEKFRSSNIEVYHALSDERNAFIAFQNQSLETIEKHVIDTQETPCKHDHKETCCHEKRD